MQPDNKQVGNKGKQDSISIHKDTIIAGPVDTGWVTIGTSDTEIIVQMPYADTANFTHQKIYDCATCLLKPEVAMALSKASVLAYKKDLRLLVFDCYRPSSYQKKMFDIVKNPVYVASPEKGSKHGSGCAVDLGLADIRGNILDMGSAFDEFSDRSNYRSKEIGSLAARNRKILRDIMIDAGFEPYDKEWWHFNYKNCSYPQSDYRWQCD